MNKADKFIRDALQQPRVIVPPTSTHTPMEKRNGVWQEPSPDDMPSLGHPGYTVKQWREYIGNKTPYAHLLTALSDVFHEGYTKDARQSTMDNERLCIPGMSASQPMRNDDSESEDDRPRNTKIIFWVIVIILLAMYFAGFFPHILCWQVSEVQQFCF